MILLIITLIVTSTLFTLIVLRVKRLNKNKTNESLIKKIQIPGPTGYWFIGNGLEFIFIDAVG